VAVLTGSGVVSVAVADAVAVAVAGRILLISASQPGQRSDETTEQYATIYLPSGIPLDVIPEHKKYYRSGVPESIMCDQHTFSTEHPNW
jgi:hypothetical protein